VQPASAHVVAQTPLTHFCVFVPAPRPGQLHVRLGQSVACWHPPDPLVPELVPDVPELVPEVPEDVPEVPEDVLPEDVPELPEELDEDEDEHARTTRPANARTMGAVRIAAVYAFFG
jgi:hypothetical protein